MAYRTSPPPAPYDLLESTSYPHRYPSAAAPPSAHHTPHPPAHYRPADPLDPRTDALDSQFYAPGPAIFQDQHQHPLLPPPTCFPTEDWQASFFPPSSPSYLHDPVPFRAPETTPPPGPALTAGMHGGRLTLAGSLDPATGIFYRTPEHPRLRTAQACEKCRTRKAKCSGEHPACQRCTARGLACEYAKEGRMRGPNRPKPKIAAAFVDDARSASTATPPPEPAETRAPAAVLSPFSHRPMSLIGERPARGHLPASRLDATGPPPSGLYRIPDGSHSAIFAPSRRTMGSSGDAIMSARLSRSDAYCSDDFSREAVGGRRASVPQNFHRQAFDMNNSIGMYNNLGMAMPQSSTPLTYTSTPSSGTSSPVTPPSVPMMLSRGADLSMAFNYDTDQAWPDMRYQAFDASLAHTEKAEWETRSRTASATTDFSNEETARASAH